MFDVNWIIQTVEALGLLVIGYAIGTMSGIKYQKAKTEIKQNAIN